MTECLFNLALHVSQPAVPGHCDGPVLVDALVPVQDEAVVAAGGVAHLLEDAIGAGEGALDVVLVEAAIGLE